MELEGKTIVLGVTGGIAAYWAAEIIGVLRNREADVHVKPTLAHKAGDVLRLPSISDKIKMLIPKGRVIWRYLFHF